VRRKHLVQFQSRTISICSGHTFGIAEKQEHNKHRSQGMKVCKTGGRAVVRQTHTRNQTHKSRKKTLLFLKQVASFFEGIYYLTSPQFHIPEVRVFFKTQLGDSCVVALSQKYLHQFLSLMVSLFMYAQEEFMTKICPYQSKGSFPINIKLSK
jgi:hypothetical protein